MFSQYNPKSQYNHKQGATFIWEQINACFHTKIYTKGRVFFLTVPYRWPQSIIETIARPNKHIQLSKLIAANDQMSVGKISYCTYNGCLKGITLLRGGISKSLSTKPHTK